MGRSSWIIQAGPEYNHVSGEEEGTGRSDTQHREERKRCGERGPTHTYHTGTQTYHRHTHTQRVVMVSLDSAAKRITWGDVCPRSGRGPGTPSPPSHCELFLYRWKATSQSKTQTSGRNLDEFPRATLADDHKRDGLKQPKFIISQLWRSKAYGWGGGSRRGCAPAGGSRGESLSCLIQLLEATPPPPPPPPPHLPVPWLLVFYHSSLTSMVLPSLILLPPSYEDLCGDTEPDPPWWIPPSAYSQVPWIRLWHFGASWLCLLHKSHYSASSIRGEIVLQMDLSPHFFNWT